MKSTGIIRKVDELGRIVLPIELRNTFGFDKGSPVEIYVDGNSVILKKYQPTCVFCGSDTKTEIFKDKYICEKCKKALSEAK